MRWRRVVPSAAATHPGSGGEATVLWCIVASFLVLGSGPAIGQTIDSKLPMVTDAGAVNDIVRVGNTIYISGSFQQVGPRSGQGVPVSSTTGQPVGVYPKIAGTVAVATADGHGGWFIGGDFSSVAGSERHFLARVLADGSLSAWDPQPNAPVEAMVLCNDTLYVGGSFTACAGASRGHGAAFDVRTAALTGWDPAANAAIAAIAADGKVVYVGGAFTALDTLQRAYLGAVDRATGAATPWNPGADSVVLALAVRGNEVYAGGYFHHVGGMPRSLVAVIDRAEGAVLAGAWAIVRYPACNACDAGPFVDALTIDGDRVYLGGSFTHVDGTPRSGAAAITRSSGAVSGWDPQLTGAAPFPYCRAMAVDHGVVYLGGQFDGLKGVSRPGAGAVDTSGRLVDWNPRPNAALRTVTVSGATTYIGGEFGSVWNWQPRRFLAALDATTGEVTPWNPSPNNVVGPIRVSGNTVYVAGAFETIGGQPRTCLAAIDAQSGEVLPWNPGVDAGIYPPIWDMVVHHGIVYLGGLFNGVGGQPRYCLGAVDSVTGQATAWNPQVDDIVDAMALRGDTLYVGGWFSHVGTSVRSFLAAVETSGNLLDWAPEPNDVVQAMAVADGQLFIGGFFSQVGGQPRRVLASVDCATGAVNGWSADANPQVRCLAVANHVLYAGGWFTQVGGGARSGLAAIDTHTGALLSWDPRPQPGYVSALHPSNEVLYVGGSFDHLGPELRTGLAAVSLARGPDPGPFPQPGRLLAVAQNAPNPVRTSTMVRFGLAAPATVTLTVFDLAGRTIATPLRNDFEGAGSHAVEVRMSEWPSGVYYYRVEADGAAAVRKMVVVK